MSIHTSISCNCSSTWKTKIYSWGNWRTVLTWKVFVLAKEIFFLYYPNIQTFLQLMATSPVTSCECEISISLLKLIKIPLGSTMRQDRLNGLALMCLLHDIKVEPEELVDEFSIPIQEVCCCSSEQLHTSITAGICSYSYDYFL